MNRSVSVVALLVIASLLVTPVAVADENDDIPTNAQNTGVHDSLVAALAHADLVTTLQGDGPFTVFAPTDQAFADAGIDLSTFDTDEENATLTDILLYHVLSGSVNSSQVTDGMSAVMVNGDKASFTVVDGAVMVGDANVTTADVAASNGIIHVIDKVLMPPPGDICYNMVSHTIVAGASNMECNSYMYVENYTMGGQTITGCYNTVTHQVTNISQAMCGAYMWTPAVNIATTAQATTIHTALVAALGAADLVNTLSGEVEYTVFAPTDDAFAAAGIDLDSFDTAEEIATLTDILLYHVVAGTTLSTDLADGANTVTAANGDDLTITVADGAVTVGEQSASVTLADVPASNGVIHVIDQVLMPPADAPDTTDCAAVIGIDASGLAYDQTDISVDVGDTVCWIWSDESMGHNVAETGGPSDNYRKMSGVYSGAAAETVDFRHTFTEDETFYYMCEPHVSMDMRGKITVGNGTPPAVPAPDDEPSNTVPGFGIVAVALSAFAALILIRVETLRMIRPIAPRIPREV